MNLLEYLFYNKILKSVFARSIGIHPFHLYNCLNGVRVMGWKTCYKIEKATKGIVKAEDMRKYSEEQYRLKNGK